MPSDQPSASSAARPSTLDLPRAAGGSGLALLDGVEAEAAQEALRECPPELDAEPPACARPSAPPTHFHSLDTLRGLAAFAVVFNHWKHFCYVGVDGGPALDRSVAPFYDQLFALYEHGWIAVDFFFSLSGFVFFWLYSERIGARTVSTKSFVQRRFSRLYPLHLVTLLVMLGLQTLSLSRTGSYTIYPYNDGYHFLLNLGFLSGWGIERGLSFDAPNWSVSIEVLLYAVFFLVCLSARARKPRSLLLFAALGLGLRMLLPNIGRGIFSFFLGGLVYASYLRLIARSDWRRALRPAAAILCCGLACLVLELRYGWLGASLESLARSSSGTISARAAGMMLGKLPELLVTGLLFPLTILTLALFETARGSLSRRFAFLGAWSYSAYLWHVPLQVALVLTFGALGVDARVMNQGWAMGLFFGLLFVCSHYSYNYLERPAQELLRRRFAGRRG